MSVTRAGLEWPLVGRDEELKHAGDLLRRAEHNAVVVAGDAGVGKTRVLDQCLAIGRDLGFRPARVAATEASRAIPLGALSPLLPEAGGDAAASADALARLAAAVRELARDRPLLLAVDDAHLLDETSAVAVHQTAIAGDVVVVASVRSGEVVPDAVRALWKDGAGTRIDLSPLDEQDVGALLDQVLDGPLDPATTHALFGVSRGNALYLRELVLAALDVGMLSDETGLWRLDAITRSPRLIELVAARVADLGADERDALEFVAFGEPVDLARLQHVFAADTLEQLEQRALLRIGSADESFEVRLAHPLHGEVLRDQVSAVRSMAIQRRLADLFTGSGGPAPNEVLRVAIWRLESNAPLDVDLMLHAARTAGRDRDWDLAARLARAAYEGSPSLETGASYAQALWDRSAYAHAATVLAETLASVEDHAIGDDLRAQLWSARAWALFFGGETVDAERELAEAAARVQSDDVRDELLARRAMFVLLGGDVRGALAVAEPLLGAGEGRVGTEAATVCAVGMAVAGRTREAAAVVERGLELTLSGDASGMDETQTLRAARALAAGEEGPLTEAVAIAEDGHADALSSGSVPTQAWFALTRGRVLHQAGQLEDGSRAFTEGAVLFEQLGRTGLERWCRAGLAWCEAQRGDVQAATDALARVDALDPAGVHLMDADLLRARAGVEVATGRRDDAASSLGEAIEVGRSSGAVALAHGAAYDLVRLGDAEKALVVLRELTSQVDGPLPETRLAAAESVAADDPERIVEQGERFASLGAGLHAAELLALASGLHRSRGEARAARGLARRSAALVVACGGARTPALLLASAAADLTPRQREVSELAAAGLSNPEIADRLDVSARTVANQLQRVYEKLGINARGELAEALDLVD